MNITSRTAQRPAEKCHRSSFALLCNFADFSDHKSSKTRVAVSFAPLPRF